MYFLSTHLWFKIYFLLSLCMVMYDKDYETKEKKFEPRIKVKKHFGIAEKSSYSYLFFLFYILSTATAC